MAAWNSTAQTIVSSPAAVCESHPGWLLVDCGCCAGLEWGGNEPRECRDCGGGGHLALHVDSGVLAQYPGGPFAGVASAEDVRRAVAEAKAP